MRPYRSWRRIKIVCSLSITVFVPTLQQPMAFGADIVIHSATKYLDGQGRCLGGAVVGRDEHMEQVLSFIRTCGPSMSPFNAWVFLNRDFVRMDAPL